MQVYKKIAISFLLSAEVIFGSIFCFADSLEMPEMPSMPTISTMPQITSPTVDGGFYKPSVPTPPEKPEVKKVEKSEKEEKKEEKTTNTISSLSTISSSSSSEDILSSILLGTTTDALTAQDISSLYDYGLFSDISSLNVNTQSASTNLLLNQILNSLDELKKEQGNVSVSEKESMNNVKMDSQTFKKREPAILRFKINGYNITDSLSKFFFSEPEPDGTFLMTADRKYFADNKKRTETFYILFKSCKAPGGSVSYEVIPTVVQDYKNENSFIYKLANQKNLKAEKTGNLVVMHYSASEENEINIDLLLNLDN